MDPSYARKLLDYNKHTSDPAKFADPFAYISEPWTPLLQETEARMRNGTWELSDQRAKICAMNRDPITAGLWALSGFDPALIHIAELREHFAELDEGDQIRVTIDRLLAVYVEGQCRELLDGAGITTHEADHLIDQRLLDISDVTADVLTCSTDPLAVEVMGYAMRLGTLTAHGTAPWRRFAAVLAECANHMMQDLARR